MMRVLASTLKLKQLQAECAARSCFSVLSDRMIHVPETFCSARSCCTGEAIRVGAAGLAQRNGGVVAHREGADVAPIQALGDGGDALGDVADGADAARVRVPQAAMPARAFSTSVSGAARPGQPEDLSAT
jgi:hypothetical protein